jgi:hypothetical protein
VRSTDGKRVAVAADGDADAGVTVERATASEVRADLRIGCFEKRDLPDRRSRGLRAEIGGDDGRRQK